MLYNASIAFSYSKIKIKKKKKTFREIILKRNQCIMITSPSMPYRDQVTGKKGPMNG